MAGGWYLYCLECHDGSVYTGIAVDVEARFAQHTQGSGARYTRSHPPKQILARVKFSDRSLASKAEYGVKQLSTAAKWELCLHLQRVQPASARRVLRRYVTVEGL